MAPSQLRNGAPAPVANIRRLARIGFKNQHLSHGGILDAKAFLVEILLSAFFAVACFRARAHSIGAEGLGLRQQFALTDRLQRLRQSRWQWFAMVLLLVMLRLQKGTPLMAELTVLVQLIVFLALPTDKPRRDIAVHVR